MHYHFVLGLVWTLFAAGSDACTIPPAHWTSSPYSMVTETPTIVLAKVTRVERDGQWSTAYFESVEPLRGDPATSFSLRGWFENEGLDDFSGHRDPRFWVANGGSAMTPGDCKAYGVFETGQSYLVFLDGPNYPRSFENVRSKDDLWYQTIVEALGNLETVLEAP